MASVNKVILVGNLGRDPETRYLTDGAAVTSMSLATTDRWKDKATGEQKEQTEWHRLVAFGRLAEIAGEYLHKGSAIYVEGKLRTRSYEKDGITRYSTEIILDSLQFLSSKRDGDDAGDEAPPQRQAAPARQAAAPQRQAAAPSSRSQQSIADLDDDIPF